METTTTDFISIPHRFFQNWGFCRNYGHADYSSTRNCCARRPCKQLIDYLTEVHQRRKNHRCKFWTDDFSNRFSCYWAFCSEVRLTLWPSAFRLLLWRFIYTSTNLCLVFICVILVNMFILVLLGTMISILV